MYCNCPEKNVAFLTLLSLSVAYLEVQIEGSHGWAARLPTWRYKIGCIEVTGYHLALLSTLFLFAHLPFLLIDLQGSQIY